MTDEPIEKIPYGDGPAIESIRKGWFQDEDHVLVMGVLWGTLLKAGIECISVGDDHGHYKPYLQIVIPNPLDLEPIRVTIQVMPGAPRGEQDE